MRYIYLHGFASSPLSTKARFFSDRCRESGIHLEIPELAPDFEQMTISGQLAIVRKLASTDDVTVFGSSLGGYVAALYAAEAPRVRQVILLAPAFGLAGRWGEALGGDRLHEWQSRGRLSFHHFAEGRERHLSYEFIVDADQHPAYPSITQPALVFHGRYDTTVPPSVSEEFCRRGEDRKLILLDSGHELTDVMDLLWEKTARFIGFPVFSTVYKNP